MPNPIRVKAAKGIYKGDTFTNTRTFTKEEALLFGDLTLNYNPVHYDKDLNNMMQDRCTNKQGCTSRYLEW